MMAETKVCPYRVELSEIKTRVALLERAELDHRKLNQEARDSRKGVWDQLNALREDLSVFKLAITKQVSEEVLKLWVKVAAGGAITGIIATVIAALVVSKLTTGK